MNLPDPSAAKVADRHALYRELVLEHARAPRNFGLLPHATHRAEGINPLCGDKLELSLLIDADSRISQAGFIGTGCAISIASASILTELIAGLTIREACALFGDFQITLDCQDDNAMPAIAEPLRALAGVRRFPSRIKCATLAWHAMANAVHERDADVVTTE